ncbi:hypothetical protein PAV_3c00320 [Paenibacillus alvei DSM 29]|nr:hypothetical protein PAV_3c00320 [Paenibacillus alvei DSM 29]
MVVSKIRRDTEEDAMKIQTEEEYQQTIERIIKGAEMIDHPLTTPEKREKYMQLYDTLVAAAREYLMRECAEKFPYLKQIYSEHGLLPNEGV